MKFMKRTVAAAALLAVLVACSSGKSSPAAAGQASLEGQEWRAATIAGKAASAPTPWIVFETGKVSGNDGCNTIGGDYSVHGSTIKIGPLSGTLMACENSDAAQGQAFVSIMGGPTVTYDISGATLNIHSPRGDIIFRAVATVPPVPGPT
jgi:heat shock protein HslJ